MSSGHRRPPRAAVAALAIALWATAAWALAARGADSTDVATHYGHSLDGPVQATPTVSLPIDDFEEEDWPAGGPWTIVWDPEDPRTIGYTWAPRTCRASSGTRSLWAVGGGERGSLLACGEPYPANIRSTVRLSLDLRPHAGAKVLALVFDMWSNTISDSAVGDFFSVNYLMPNDEGFLEQVTVLDWTGATGPSFRAERLDLLDLAEVHDPFRRFRLAGQQVELEFIFRTARDSTFRPTGVFIDNVRLERDGVATATVPSPTPLPATATATATTLPATATPSATAPGETPATATPSRTSTVGATSTVPGMTPGKAYLAIAKRRS